MQSQLDKLRQRVGKGKEPSVATAIYYLAKELHCLPDLLGREYEVSNGSNHWIIKQKPMKISSMMVLLEELQDDYKRQEREMKKSKGRKK